jgi:2,5-diketo-D-gluconate reductase B
MGASHLQMPKIGYGTWMRRGRAGRACMEAALEAGYRHIDTAQGYQNEAMVGAAVAASGLARPEIFITTKVKPPHLTRAMFIPTVEESLERLRISYVDLLLIHWPSPQNEVPMASYIEDLLKARDLGYARSIGLSNFTQPLLTQAEEIAGPKQFSHLQIEVHPFHQNREMVAIARSKGLHVTAFSPLALGRVAEDPIIQAIAAEHAATTAQVTLAWLMARDFTVIPSSSNAGRIRENLASIKLALSGTAMERLDSLNRNMRLLSPEHAPPWDEAKP